MAVGRRATRTAESVKICQVLELTKWNKTQAAKLLGVSYKILLNKIKLYELG